MAPNATCLILAVTLLLSGTLATEIQSLDLLKLLVRRPWLLQSREKAPRDYEHFNQLLNGMDPSVFQRVARDYEEDSTSSYDDDEIRTSSKRSAVASALHGNRRRRQPSSNAGAGDERAIGKPASPYFAVGAPGVLSDVGSFFGSLRNNLESMASLPPDVRAQLFQEPPTVVHAPIPGSNGGGGSGSGIRRLHALRPLRPAGNMRTYNRRSLVQSDEDYPAANYHDPGLLWTGLGRR